MNCDTITKQLPLMLYGELSFDEEEQVHQHLETCAVCNAEYSRVREFHKQLNDAEVRVPAELLQNCRRNLRVTVAALNDAGDSPHKHSWTEKFGRWFEGSAWTFAWKPTVALTLLAMGFVGGQLIPRQGPLAQMGQPNEAAISRVRYVQPEDSGNIRLVVEETRQRVLSGSLDDDRIRGLLLTAAREANDPGVRVETVDLLKGHSESAEVRRALLAALQSDANPGVRLKAIEALRETAADDKETRRVLAQVLLTDDNPGVRTQAIDLLTKRREPSMVGVLQELMAREDNNYVRLKCQKVLHEMNASAETF